MKNFLLLDIRDIKKNIQYMDNPLWKLVKLSPYYSEMCTCYSRNYNYTFSELIHFFLEGSESERIVQFQLSQNVIQMNYINLYVTMSFRKIR